MNTKFLNKLESMGALHTWELRVDRECPKTLRWWSVGTIFCAYWRNFEIGIRFANVCNEYGEFCIHLGPFTWQISVRPYLKD